MSSWEGGLQEPAWGLALLACLLAVHMCWAGSRRAPERRSLWVALATANTFGALAAALAIFVAAVGDGATAAFYVGFAGSLGLLAAVAVLARHNLPGARMEQLGDAVLLGTLIIALGGYCVAIPGFVHGDLLLTTVFVVDLCAVLLGA